MYRDHVDGAQIVEERWGSIAARKRAGTRVLASAVSVWHEIKETSILDEPRARVGGNISNPTSGGPGRTPLVIGKQLRLLLWRGSVSR